MFFQQLLRYNKTLFFIVVGFLSAYIYINYKWGITATPINQYGMYSGKYFLKDSVRVYTLSVNNTMVDFAELSLIERDLLQSYPEYYEMEKSNNVVIFNTVSKYYKYLGISANDQRFKYINTCSDSLFSYWYKSTVERIIKKRITSLEVFKQYFVWENKKLQPIDTPVKLTFIAIN